MVARTGLFVKPLPTTPAQGTSPTDGRLVLGALFGTTGGCIAGGVFTASATQMQVTVSASVWRIPDPTNAAAVFLSPADTDLFTFSAGPASGSRIDVLWVKQNNYENSDANSRLIYGVTAGTASATPVAPALLAGQLKLGQLTVPAGVSNAAACTLVPTYGGQTVAQPNLVVATEAQLPAAGAFYGQLAAVLSVTVSGVTLPIVERWNGTAWKRWDSDWSAFALGASNMGSYGGNPGWTSQSCTWRYSSGQVLYDGTINLTGASAALTGQATVTLPVPAAASFGTDRVLAGGGALDFSANARYALDLVPAGSTLYFSARNGNALKVDTSASWPFVWATSDQLSWSLAYPPA